MMKKVIILFIFFNLSIDVECQVMFQKTFGTSTADLGHCIKQTSDKGYIAGGFTRTSLSEGNVYLLKIDSLGVIDWVKTYAISYFDGVNSVDQTFDGGYIFAGSNNLGFLHLFKVDANGNSLWIKQFKGPSSDPLDAYSVCQTLDSGFIMTGRVFRNYTPVILLIKTDVNGDSVWTKEYSNPNYYPSNEMIGNDVSQTDDGGYIVAGSAEFPVSPPFSSVTFTDINIIRTNNFGDTLWTKVFGYSYNGGLPKSNEAKSIKKTSDGGFIVGGNTITQGSNTRACMIKMDSSGLISWSKIYRGIGADDYYISSAEQTPDGGYVLTGKTGSSATGCNRPFLIKTDSLGNVSWSKLYGSSSICITQLTDHTALNTSDKGFVLITTLYSGVDHDFYIIKTDSLGNTGCIEQNLGAVDSIAPMIVKYFPTINPLSKGYTVSNVVPVVTNGGVERGDCLNVGVKEILKEDSVNIFPNPFSFSATVCFVEEQHNTVMILFNVIGEVMKRINCNGKELILEKGALKAGIYFLQIVDKNKTIINKKIIIQ